MSSAAIDQRLKELAQLYRFGMSLSGFKILGKATDVLARPAKPEETASSAKKKDNLE